MVGIHHDGSNSNVRLNGSLLHFLHILSNMKQVGVMILLVYIFIGLGVSIDDGLDVITLLMNIAFLIPNHHLFALEHHIRYLNLNNFDPLNSHLNHVSLHHTTLLLQNRRMVGLVPQTIAPSKLTNHKLSTLPLPILFLQLLLDAQIVGLEGGSSVVPFQIILQIFGIYQLLDILRFGVSLKFLNQCDQITDDVDLIRVVVC